MLTEYDWIRFQQAWGQKLAEAVYRHAYGLTDESKAAEHPPSPPGDSPASCSGTPTVPSSEPPPLPFEGMSFTSTIPCATAWCACES